MLFFSYNISMSLFFCAIERLHSFANFGCGSACAICKCVHCALGFSLREGKRQNKFIQVCTVCHRSSLFALPLTFSKYMQGGSFPMNFLRRIAFQFIISRQRSTETRLAGSLLLAVRCSFFHYVLHTFLPFFISHFLHSNMSSQFLS